MKQEKVWKPGDWSSRLFGEGVERWNFVWTTKNPSEQHLTFHISYLIVNSVTKCMTKGNMTGCDTPSERERSTIEKRSDYKNRMFSKNRTPEDISDFTGKSVEYLYNLKEKYLATVREESHYNGNGKR